MSDDPATTPQRSSEESVHAAGSVRDLPRAPGGMRAAVKSKRIKRNPAIGVVVGPMGKAAFMRHWVAQGTKPHQIRPKGGGVLALAFGFVKLVNHPGAKPNDYAGRTQRAAEGSAFDKAEDYLLKEATK